MREGGAGTAADTGAGEAAWTRDLAPRHRRVVERFFGPSPTPEPAAPAAEGDGR